MSDSGCVLERKEIFTMPEDGVKVDRYASQFVHRMFVQGRGRKRRVMRLGRGLGEKPNYLPSVESKEAAKQILDFIKRVGSDTLLFHGEDMLTMDPFMSSYGNEDQWRMGSKYRVNTGEFFYQSTEGDRSVKIQEGWPYFQVFPPPHSLNNPPRKLGLACLWAHDDAAHMAKRPIQWAAFFRNERNGPRMRGRPMAFGFILCIYHGFT